MVSSAGGDVLSMSMAVDNVPSTAGVDALSTPGEDALSVVGAAFSTVGAMLSTAEGDAVSTSDGGKLSTAGDSTDSASASTACGEGAGVASCSLVVDVADADSAESTAGEADSVVCGVVESVSGESIAVSFCTTSGEGTVESAMPTGDGGRLREMGDLEGVGYRSLNGEYGIERLHLVI